MTASTSALASRRVAWARTASRHPEWWLVVLVAAAWALLVLGWPAGLAHAPAADRSDMAGMPDMPGMVHGRAPASIGAAATAALIGAWLVMVVAMMGPGLLAEVRHLAFTTIGARRNRSVASFLTGYVAPWAALGLVLVAAVAWSDGALMGALAPTRALAGYAVLWAVVVAWQLGAPKRYALRQCLRSTPVRGRGRAADVACARAGATNSVWCAMSCGPAMLALVLAGHPPALAIALTAGLGAEKALAGGLRLVRWVALGIAAVALAVAVVAVR